MDPARIADLRRRLQADPSSIAFAQLAEEHRRAGQFDEAVEVCREGLLRHPGYLSARVTLGRALAELGQIAEAEHEFEVVLRSAPDNLSAIRGVAEINHKRGKLHRALGYYQRALALARYDPELDETVERLAQEVGQSTQSSTDHNLSFAEAQQELMNAPSRVPPSLPKPSRVDFDEVLQSLGVKPDAPAPPIVEAWLSSPASPAPTPDAPVTPSESDAAADVLAQLERELRQLETVKPSGVSPPDSFVSDTDQKVIAELERWLVAIADRRQALPKSL